MRVVEQLIEVTIGDVEIRVWLDASTEVAYDDVRSLILTAAAADLRLVGEALAEWIHVTLVTGLGVTVNAIQVSQQRLYGKEGIVIYPEWP